MLVDPQRLNVGLGSRVHFCFESSGSFVFNDAQAQRDEGLRALLLVIVDSVQADSLKHECLMIKVVCNLVDACPSIATRTRAGRRSASLVMGCSAATTSFGLAESCPVVGSAALPTFVSMRWAFSSISMVQSAPRATVVLPLGLPCANVMYDLTCGWCCLQLGDVCLRGFIGAGNVQGSVQACERVSFLQEFFLNGDVFCSNYQLLDEAGVCFQYVRKLAFCGKNTTS